MNNTTTIETPSFPYAKAKKWADRVVELLSPHCEIINIAGSIRREAMFCKDIEIVCQPKTFFISTDLFGGGEWKVCPEFIKTVEAISESIVKGKFGGRYMQVILKTIGIKLDLFTPEKEDFWRQYAIRTGPKEFSQKFFAKRWLDIGWCGVGDLGLRRKRDCIAKTDVKGKVTWECVNKNGERPPVWTSEESFFEWLGIRFVEPKYR